MEQEHKDERGFYNPFKHMSSETAWEEIRRLADQSPPMTREQVIKQLLAQREERLRTERNENG
jgi:hypothetical protein